MAEVDATTSLTLGSAVLIDNARISAGKCSNVEVARPSVGVARPSVAELSSAQLCLLLSSHIQRLSTVSSYEEISGDVPPSLLATPKASGTSSPRSRRRTCILDDATTGYKALERRCRRWFNPVVLDARLRGLDPQRNKQHQSPRKVSPSKVGWRSSSAAPIPHRAVRQK